MSQESILKVKDETLHSFSQHVLFFTGGKRVHLNNFFLMRIEFLQILSRKRFQFLNLGVSNRMLHMFSATTNIFILHYHILIQLLQVRIIDIEAILFCFFNF